MLLPRLGALLLAASYTHAFKNTSPFFLLSSEPLPSDAALQSSQIALSNDLEDRLIETLEACDRKWYYIYEQDHVMAGDLQGGMPMLQKRIAGMEKGSVVDIPEVVASGGLSAQSIVERLEKACEAKGKTRSEGLYPEQEENAYQIAVTTLPSEAAGRKEILAGTDDVLDLNLAGILDSNISAVVIYISTPPARETVTDQEGNAYEMDEPYPEALHTDLKRDTYPRRRQSDDDNMQAGLPLFEKYQFLSPPIFMGLSVSLVLLLILSVGVRAISGLQVSYMAFNKEMGPNAQKPKQQ